MTPTLSVVTLRVLITALAALDTMEMAHHAPVNYIRSFYCMLFGFSKKKMWDISCCLIRHKSWFHVTFCHPCVYSNVTIAFFSLLLDINECSTNAHNCDANAFCSNSEGSYNCTCSPGYNGNGTSCTGKLYSFFLLHAIWFLKKENVRHILLLNSP